MLTLATIYEYLSTGELAQVVMGRQDLDDADSGVPKSKYKQLRNSIQLGLTDLHKRFLINERYLQLDISDDGEIYYLSSEYAESNAKSTQPNKYLKDAADPFKDDLLKISRVEDLNGNEVKLNVLDSVDALITPNDTTVRVPKTFDRTKGPLTLVYHADHPEINALLADSAPQTVKIDLPMKYLHALSLFVASRVMNPIGFSGETMHEGNNYFSKYLMAVRDIQDQGMDQTRTSDNSMFEAGGWV